uniref:RDD family protein n=1 Tax=Angiostrongylus cantonensis TaxID=6313 RepID=A0A0K0DCD4_ANGCA
LRFKLSGGTGFIAVLIRIRFPLYIWPVLTAGVIFLDWRHTQEWKANGRVSVLQTQLLGTELQDQGNDNVT